jgi:hypothetical protein
VKKFAYLGIFAVIGIISLVMIGSVAAIGTESTHTIGTIHYIRVTSTGVYRAPLDPSNLIYMATGEALFLQVPAKVSGPSNQKGALIIGLPDSGGVTHSLVLTPGRQKTLTTNPPFIWTSAGTYLISVNVFAPDGGFTSKSIGVFVS